MTFVGTIFLIVGAMGLFWFGIPTVLALSELIASRSTGHPMPPERVAQLREALYKLTGSIVFAAAGFSLLYFANQ